MITAIVDRWIIQRIFIDCESSVDVLYFNCFKQLKIPKKALMPYNRPSRGFTNHVIWPKEVKLDVEFGKEGNSIKSIVLFLVVDLPSPYSAMIGRLTLRALGAVISLSIKFPTDKGVAVSVGKKTRLNRE